MSMILIIDKDTDAAHTLAALLSQEGRQVAVLSELSLEDISARLHVDCIMMNVQTLVGDDKAYKWDTFDIDSLAAMVAEEVEFYPEARLAVYATIPNRAHSLIESLGMLGWRASYVDYMRWEEFDQFIRDSPAAVR